MLVPKKKVDFGHSSKKLKKKSSQACKSVRKIQNGKGIEQQAKTKGDQKKVTYSKRKMAFK